MKKKYIIFLNTYKKIHKNFFFLGRWCIPFGKENPSTLDRCYDYHWFNEKKKEKDLKYLNQLYETTLYHLSKKLNKIHNVNFSKKKWRIIAGPWLSSFIARCFDVSENLNNFIKKSEGKHYVDFFLINLDQITPQNYDDYVLNYSENIEYNQHIYQNIIKYSFSDNFIHLKKKKFKEKKTKTINIKYLFIKKILNFVNLYFFNRKKIFVEFNYINFLNKVRICLDFKIIPDYSLLIYDYIKKKINKNIRNEKLGLHTKDKFISFINDNILKYIPLSYLENFKDISNDVEKLNLNLKKVISTGSYYSNDFFKIFLANNLKKIKFYIAYHGGSIPKKFHNYNHDEKIADKILTWHKPVFKNQTQTFNFKLKKNLFRSKKYILLTLPISYYYPKRITFGLHSTQYLFDFFKKIELVEKIKNDEKEIKIRCLQSNVWNFKERIIKKFGIGSFDTNLKFIDSLKQSKIHICGYIDTPLSESINFNIPSLVFCDYKILKFNKRFKKLINMLVANKILFNDLNKIHNFLKENDYEIETWWNSNRIQKIIKIYKEDVLGSTKRYSHFYKMLK